MARLTLTWTIHRDRSLVTFARPLPFSGNTYNLIFEGGTDGEYFVAYLMDDSGLNCLAKSEYADGAYTIAFDSEALWNEFIREPHETRPFHCFVRSATLEGSALVEHNTIAEGDLTLLWNPLWTDKEVGRAYTMQGREGRPGNTGKQGDQGPEGKSAYELAVLNGFDGSLNEWLGSLKGEPGSLVRVQGLDSSSNETGLWHNVFVQPDGNGFLRLVVGRTGHEPSPNEDIYVYRAGDVTVSGTKTFTESPIVPEVSDVADSSNKAVNTSFLQKWWNAVRNAAVTFVSSLTAHTINCESKLVVSNENTNLPDPLVVQSGAVTVGTHLNVASTEIHVGAEMHIGAVHFKDSVEIDGAFKVQSVTLDESELTAADGELFIDGEELMRSSRFVVCSELPETPDSETFYFIAEVAEETE